MNESRSLSPEYAYGAMLAFLEAYYNRTGADELAALLGGLAVNEDGMPMDPAAWTDWLAAIAEVRGQFGTAESNVESDDRG